MAQLTMRRGPEPGRVYYIVQDKVSLGRGAKNDIVVIDNEVSREHCRFLRTDSGYDIVDLDSSNGTFVNGQKVKESWSLPSDCIVEIGDSITFTYQQDMEEGDDPQHDVDTNMLNDPDRKPYFLIVSLDNQSQPAVYPLEDAVISVGRGVDNKIIILETEVSRQHFILTREGRGYVVKDMGATNGTMLNGTILKPLDPHLLHSGDVIRIGSEIVIRFTHAPQLFMTQQHQTGTLSDTNHKKHRDTSEHRRSLPFSNTVLSEKSSEVTLIRGDFELDTLAEQALMIYAREDWEWIVAPIADALYQAEIPVWVEQYLTPGEEDWHIALDQARTECWLLIVVVTKKALEIDYIHQILRYFLNREKPIILVMPEDIRLPLGAQEAHRIGFDANNYSESLEQVIYAVRQAQQRG